VTIIIFNFRVFPVVKGFAPFLPQNFRYKPKLYKIFYVFDPKKRLIMAPEFSDRVVHHALHAIIEPLFERRFIYDSYTCRKNKGMHRAAKRVQNFIIPNGYALKADITKYFPSVNQTILFNIISKTIKCADTLRLFRTILKTSDTGLPIGALTSQLFANVYLDTLDHFIKDYLGVKRYVRYMDDFIIIEKDKEKLKDLLCLIGEFLLTNLALKLNGKTQIFFIKQGIDFCGYQIWKTHYKLRKRNIKKTKRKFRKFSELYKDGKISQEKIHSSLMSFLGYANHSNNKKTIKSVVNCLRLR
jgi:RNA-directed DNA polymerase